MYKTASDHVVNRRKAIVVVFILGNKLLQRSEVIRAESVEEIKLRLKAFSSGAIMYM